MSKLILTNLSEMVLYLGNKLSKHGKALSVMEALIPKFVQFIEVKSASDKKNQLVRAVDMLRAFLRNQCKSKLILIDVYSNLAFAYAIIFSSLSWVLRKPYVLFLHGGNLPDRHQRSTTVFSFILSRAERIVAPSNYLASYFLDRGFPVQVIPNFIELQNYPFKVRKKTDLKLLYIRGFGKPYNPLMALQAIKILLEKKYTPHLTMLGNTDEAWYESVIDYIRKNNLFDFVKILPKMPREEWVTLSQGYDIMISNPDIDNTPVSVIEGMALGLVVISTKVGGIPYLCPGGEAVLVPKNDSNTLANKLIDLYNDANQMEKMSLRGRVFAAQFDWSQVQKKWEDLFNSVNE